MTDKQSTTTALIPLMVFRIGTQDCQSVDGRLLHGQLGLARHYADWMKAWIKRANLQDHKDYEVFHADVKNPTGGRPSAEYALTLDAAKCIAMMAGGEKGDKVREYFLACERQAFALPDPVERYPELRAIRELLIATAEARDEAALARQEAQAAEARAIRAEGKADIALADAHHMTISDFILANGLHRQFPESQYARLAKWLGDFCTQWALPTYSDPVVAKPWPNEKSYPLQAFAALLRHEQTKGTQIHLVPKA